MTKLKYYRTKLNLSIKYVAGACGVTFAEVVEWEYNGKAPKSSAKTLAKIYGVKKKDLEGEVPATDQDEQEINKLKKWAKKNARNVL